MLLASRPLRRGDATSIVAVTDPDDSEKMNATLPSLGEILRESPYALTIFEPEDIEEIVLFLKRGKPYLRCYTSDTDRPATPEEIVRQLYVRVLVGRYGYDGSRISLEKPVQFGSSVHTKAADIVVADKDDPDASYLIVDVKGPQRKDGLEQLKSYCNAEGSPIGVWTNGQETIFLHRDEPNLFRSLSDIPTSSQTLSDVLDERWTIEDLARENRLVRERKSLKSVMLDMENLVLANAGVDPFEEVFKLIYAKLYDEWNAARGGEQKRYLDFRVGGSTPAEFHTRISRLFDAAKKQWPGVYLDDDRIDLGPSHLLTCGSFLEDIKLFNSNLQIIDEAFEYLALQVGKAKKGQYFTPRHVIDMCVGALNPTPDEHVIDTAAGSCGFTVHSIFHVWGDQCHATGPELWQRDYARDKVFAIDFDRRSIKIAKALNLIAGDGSTNVFRANSLDAKSWDEEVRVGLKDRLTRFKDQKKDRWNRENYEFLAFDVVLTNPPFAGDIEDSRIIHRYELGRRATKGFLKKVSRDVLFLERNLQFLRPGGRICIVLPQGRLNNVSDERFRAFIAEHARLLAVVSLHVNTFKPHANAKTSVLFLQKWNDDPDLGPLCPRVDDYPVFFASSSRPGKDSKGEYVYQLDESGRPLLDARGHMQLSHDLFDIRDALIDFLREQGLSFWRN